MLTCPRCQRLIDERTLSACPHCAVALNFSSAPSLHATQTINPTTIHSASLLSSEPPGTNPVRRNPRVSLTGEVLDDTPPAAAPAGGANVPPHAGMPLHTVGRNLPSASQSSSSQSPSSQRRETSPDNSDRKALLINLSVMLVLLTLCVGGGGWSWTHRTNPRAQVARYLHAIQWLDWGVVHDLSASRPGGKSRHEFISFMDDKFDNNGVLNIVARKKMEKTTFTIGEPVFHGEEAIVPVTRSATPFTEAKSLPLTLTNFGGVWKIHPLMENPLEMVRDPDEDKKAAGALLQSLFPGTK